MSRYLGLFTSVEDVWNEFSITKEDVKDREIVFAFYEQGSYDGSAQVLIYRKKKLYEISSSHCSCYGLEGTWAPQEVTWEQLAMRKFGYYPEDKETRAALLELIRQHVPRA